MGHDVFHTITPKQQNAEQQNLSSLQWVRIVNSRSQNLSKVV